MQSLEGFWGPLEKAPTPLRLRLSQARSPLSKRPLAYALARILTSQSIALETVPQMGLQDDQKCLAG